MLQEQGRLRPLQLLASAFSGTEEGEEDPKPSGVLPGGRGASAPSSVRAAAERVSRGRDGKVSDQFKRRAAERRRPPKGGVMEGNTLVIDIDDPGAMSAYNAKHPKMTGSLRSRGVDPSKARRH